MEAQTVKRLILLIAVTVGVLALPAGALTYDETDGAYGPPGSQLVLGTDVVPTADVGLTCDVVVDLANNESTRPGSDITVSTGGDSELFPDTEGTPGAHGPVTVPMVMGETLTVTLTFGPDTEFDGHGFENAAFSGAGTVTIGACETPPAVGPVVVSPDVVAVSPAEAVRPTAAVRPTPAASPVVARPAFTG
jgi:hypothetical protein